MQPRIAVHVSDSCFLVGKNLEPIREKILQFLEPQKTHGSQRRDRILRNFLHLETSLLLQIWGAFLTNNVSKGALAAPKICRTSVCVLVSVPSKWGLLRRESSIS